MERFKSISSFLFWTIISYTVFAQEAVPYNQGESGIVEFFLPKAKVELVISVTKYKVNTPEFDAELVNKYLPVKSKRKEFFEISDIRVNVCYDRDEKRHFILKSTGNNEYFFTKEGVLKGINVEGGNFSCDDNFDYIKKKNLTDEGYNRYFIKKNFKTVKDTSYKIIRTDSLVYRKAVITQKMEKKNEEDKIYDLVHYLIKTRKRKFRLISGLDTINYNPSVFEMKLKNLDSLENKLYKALTGGYSEETKVYRYELDLDKNTDTIAYFSPYSGITGNKGLPIVVFFRGEKIKSDDIEGKGIPYIIPSKCYLEINAGDFLHYATSFMVPQWGQVRYLTGKIEKLEYGKAGNIEYVSFK